MEMEFKFVTCPETAHLELIGYEAHPLGMLLDSCSRFSPPCELTCRRTCAALLDRRARDEREAALAVPLAVGDDTSLGIDLNELEGHHAPTTTPWAHPTRGFEAP